MANAPIQVILQPDAYRKNREPRRPGSAGTDFFEGRNAEFQVHREKLAEQVRSIQRQIADPEWSSKYGDVGYVKVTMRSSALAKSHRPVKALFPAQRTPSVGTDELGQMICEASDASLEKVDDAIARAELQVRMRQTRDGELIPTPTRYRCEVGAIEKIEAWGKEDKRRFSVQEAVRWLANPDTGQAYLAELFERIPPLNQWDALPESKRRLLNSFVSGLKELGNGLEARMVEGLPSDAIFMEVRLSTSDEPPAVFAHGSGVRDTVKRAPFDQNGDRHAKLIGFLEQHPLVRHVRLPLTLIRSATPAPSAAAGKISLPIRSETGVYPRVGIIDGGVTNVLADWIRHKWDFLADEHEDLKHGSFIAGLLVAGRMLNGDSVCGEPDGCDIVDLNIFPDQTQPDAFVQYYPGGLSDFFDELERAVERARTQYSTRIFNLSLNAVSPVDLDRYSLEARRLDEIADRHDVVFVISAGNLQPGKMRVEWPADETQAAAILAAHRDDQLFIPAESIRNLSVAALNVPGLSNSIPEVPARYSRRGPGLRTGVKPDLCHFGGSGTRCPTKGHGLFSIATAGDPTDGCGTSYAAPLVAKTLSTLESGIEGAVSRETLLALAAHHASLPVILQSDGLGGIARQLVGFGRPGTAADALGGNDHQITMLFASRLHEGKILDFRFTWPPSLVGANGKCRGDVLLTLVATPPLDYRHGAEFVRVNIEAPLQQETKDGKFKSILEPTYVFFSDDDKTTEADLIEHKFKWAPIKAFSRKVTRGIGTSSNFRLLVNYLTRADEHLPTEGVPFTVMLTISDPDGEKPIFQEMRQTLQSAGVSIADIRTAARVTPRV